MRDDDVERERIESARDLVRRYLSALDPPDREEAEATIIARAWMAGAFAREVKRGYWTRACVNVTREQIRKLRRRGEVALLDYASSHRIEDDDPFADEERRSLLELLRALDYDAFDRLIEYYESDSPPPSRRVQSVRDRRRLREALSRVGQTSGAIAETGFSPLSAAGISRQASR